METVVIPGVPFPLPEWVAAPALPLGFLLASINVFLFHALAAHPERSALYFWPYALAGFAAGHLVGVVVGVQVGLSGDVQWLAGSIGAWLTLAIVNAVGQP